MYILEGYNIIITRRQVPELVRVTEVFSRLAWSLHGPHRLKALYNNTWFSELCVFVFVFVFISSSPYEDIVLGNISYRGSKMILG